MHANNLVPVLTPLAGNLWCKRKFPVASFQLPEKRSLSYWLLVTGYSPLQNMLLKSLIQWIHVGSVVLMIGGFFFFRVVLLPIANRSTETANLIASALRRFSGIVWTALLTILISGLYNFITFFRSARADAAIDPVVSDYSLYIFVLGIKLFIVFLIFTLAVVLTFPYPVFDVYQKRPAPWLNLTIVLGLIVIFLSAYLRRLG